MPTWINTSCIDELIDYEWLVVLHRPPHIPNSPPQKLRGFSNVCYTGELLTREAAVGSCAGPLGIAEAHVEYVEARLEFAEACWTLRKLIWNP